MRTRFITAFLFALTIASVAEARRVAGLNL